MYLEGHPPKLEETADSIWLNLLTLEQETWPGHTAIVEGPYCP